MGAQYAGKDRRKFKRVKANSMITLKISSLAEVLTEVQVEIRGGNIAGVMIDISEGGIALITEQNIPVSALTMVKFFLYNDSPLSKESNRTIEPRAEIRYNLKLKEREHRLGLAFRILSDDDRLFIANYVSWEAGRVR